MMDVKSEPELDAPIPGMSLTHELGGRPWQRPTQYSTLEDTLDFYLTRIGSEKLMYNLLSVVESGVSIPTIAETLTLGGVMEGKHSVDVAILANPVIVEYIKGLADTAGINYIMDSQESYMDSEITEVDLNTVEQDLIKKKVLPQETVEQLKEDIVENTPKKGLMSRDATEEEVQ
jgi:hypothetical protein